MLKTWIDLLTGENTHKEIEFCNLAENSKSTQLAIMKYRRILFENGRGSEIKLEDLKENWNDNKKLKQLLRELFLEPIGDKHINLIKNKVSDIDKFYYKYLQNKNHRALNIALTI